jgi:hypothetical protein
MTTEWLKVMLEEIARKRAEAEQAEAERRRREESAGSAQRAEEPDARTGSNR